MSVNPSTDTVMSEYFKSFFVKRNIQKLFSKQFMKRIIQKPSNIYKKNRSKIFTKLIRIDLSDQQQPP